MKPSLSAYCSVLSAAVFSFAGTMPDAKAISFPETVPAAPPNLPAVNVTPYKSMTYTEDNTTVANPERGFYFHPGDCDVNKLNKDSLVARRNNEGTTLVLCIFYLTDYKEKPITALKPMPYPADYDPWRDGGGPIEKFDFQAKAAREAGVKLIVRFAYTHSETGDDATVDWVLGHIQDLSQIIRKNKDVIAILEQGFVGAYGEGYYTKNFGDFNQEDWGARAAVVTALQDVLPRSVVQVRTPKMKIKALDPSSTMLNQPQTGFSDVTSGVTGTKISRIGFHNDCLLRKDSWEGYYDTSLRSYVDTESRFVPVGGETCFPVINSTDWNDHYAELQQTGGQDHWTCSYAEGEMQDLHYTYLNGNPNNGFARWSAEQGCLARIKKNIGYRFYLSKAVISPSEPRQGQTLQFILTMANNGYGQPLGHRNVYLVLRNTVTQTELPPLLIGNTREWNDGTWSNRVSWVKTFAPVLPASTPVGDYKLLLSLVDPAFPTRPEYAIRLMSNANGVPIWDKKSGQETGLNDLGMTIKVKPKL